MKSIITSIRAKQGAFFRHVFIFFWILSISNSILFPAYTLDENPENSNRMVIQVGKQPSVSFLGLVFELALSVNANTADALLADTQDDGLEKLDFITSRHATLKNPESLFLNLLPVRGEPRPEVPALGTITPPPRG
ncbi:MAG: hypothetical protein KIT62_15245 [Cyclobacteriaceae bacterium]|nr:hypothetical protein [Cyclobacteriaceae bacterium]